MDRPQLATFHPRRQLPPGRAVSESNGSHLAILEADQRGPIPVAQLQGARRVNSD
jgi:hypothetical protein